ncbi:MAG TPA: hypothetical protein VLO07_03150 [Thermoanaerobaculia bacterium]|nr:hypothetical protein [Thermoanaerobaculia bacterium]
MGRPLFRDRQPVVLALLLGAMAVGGTCPLGQTRSDTKAPQAAKPLQPAFTPTPAAARDLFTSTVSPMLAERCSPCHVPGGKMYERLPFDRPEVVSSNVEGIRRRLKGENRETLERWLATLPAPPTR